MVEYIKKIKTDRLTMVTMNIGKMTKFSNSKRALATCALLIAAMLFCACNQKAKPPVTPDYGTVYNHLRDSLGIKLIPVGWTISEQYEDSNGALWIYYTNPCVDTTNKKPQAFYAGKTLEIRNDSLIYEMDSYIAIRFSESNKLIVEKNLEYLHIYDYVSNNLLYIHHDYSVNPQPVGKFGVQYEDGRTRRDSLGELLPMTRAEADSILATWGMKYP